MWWPLFERDGQPASIETGRFRFQSVTADIETLNRAAETSIPPDDPLEITAISAAQYPFVKDRYILTACGASIGERYGPKLVAREPLTIDDLKRRNAVIAIPGERTSAFLTLSIMLGRGTFRHGCVPFDQIIERVADGTYDAGLVIHEGQLTFEEAGLHLIADLGEWWWERHRLPLPLGVNAIRRDLEQRHGPGTLREIAGTLRRSVEYALAHRDEAIEHAMQFARGLNVAIADRFIGMYVNARTLEFGDEGWRAIKTLLNEGHRAGLCPPIDELDFVG